MTEPKDLTKEEYREYEFLWAVDPSVLYRQYRVTAPQKLWIGTTTHRVLDGAGMVHCVPAPGERGCVLRWKPKDAADPVQF